MLKHHDPRRMPGVVVFTAAAAIRPLAVGHGRSREAQRFFFVAFLGLALGLALAAGAGLAVVLAATAALAILAVPLPAPLRLAHSRFMKRRPSVASCSSLTNILRQILVAAARLGRARPKASM